MMAQHRLIGIIGGTPTDAQMGVEVFHKHGLQATGIGISDTPEEQTELQVLYPDKLQELVINHMLRMKNEQGIHTVCIYCNSMSAAINTDFVAMKTGMKVVTPLDVYRTKAQNYQHIGLMAANCQSLAGIEKVIKEENESADIIGFSMLQIAIEIERKTDPRQIIRSLGIVHITRFFEAADVEVLILGCTHFPYLQDSLKGLTRIPILNPAEEMVRLCME
jgi:glutamate racemase